jgi:hypothetical protein
MMGEVQWNVQRGQKLHLDCRDQTRATGCMDDETRDQVQERFATIAMLMEDVSARLLSISGNAQDANTALSLLRLTLLLIDENVQEVVQILTLETD